MLSQFGGSYSWRAAPEAALELSAPSEDERDFDFGFCGAGFCAGASGPTMFALALAARFARWPPTRRITMTAAIRTHAAIVAMIANGEKFGSLIRSANRFAGGAAFGGFGDVGGLTGSPASAGVSSSGSNGSLIHFGWFVTADPIWIGPFSPTNRATHSALS